MRLPVFKRNTLAAARKHIRRFSLTVLYNSRRTQARSRTFRTALVETLEDRALLTSSLGIMGPISNQLPINDSHVSSELLQFAAPVFNAAADTTSFRSQLINELSNDGNGRVVVRVTTSDADALVPQLEAFGMEIIASLPDHNLIEGYATADTIRSLRDVDIPEMLGVVPIYKPSTAVGSVTGQADFVHEADRVRAALPQGFDGTGVKIGLLSDTYDALNGAAGDIASGDLPAAGVQVLKDLNSGSDEGRAMLQLVHDIAPAAQLGFATAFVSEADFANQILRLGRQNGPFRADIITDDIFYFNEPLFQDGLITQAIDEVVNQHGVAYFALAGNLANEAYHSTNFNPVNEGGFFFHDFDPSFGVDTRQRIVVAPGGSLRLSLQWDDPFFTTSGVDTDLNIFVRDASTNAIVGSSANNNLQNQQPQELVTVVNNTNSAKAYDVKIQIAGGPLPGLMKWVNYGRNNSAPLQFVEYATGSATVIPHAAATRGLGVGAVNYFDRDVPADFTSRGPATILFNSNGTRKPSAEFRLAPDIAAIQNTDTTFFGSDIDGNGFPNFSGTSAAAPTAAAIAALVLDANPSFSPDDIYNRLISTASDIGAPGVDIYTGHGLINAWDAVQGAPTQASIPVVENFNNGDLPDYFEINGTGDSQTVVTNQNSPRGSRHLTMQSGPRSESGLNELILNINTQDVTDVTLNFWQKEFNDNNHAMPLSFNGSSNSDGVAFSTDGITWHRITSLVGNNSTNSYKKFGPFNLSTIAANRGVSLSNSVQIKFQQFGQGSINQDGMAFDDISVTGKREFYFSAQTAAGQRELHFSDGTAAGTKLLKNLNGAANADPQQLTPVGNTLFFTARDSNGQRELYKSDGTAAGTRLVKNISGSTNSVPLELTAVGNKLYFTALLANGQRELFVSDGTAAGTQLVKNLSGATSAFPKDLVAYKNKLYFTAKLASGERELHESNGTSGGTKLVKNLSGSKNANPVDLTVAGNTLYFTATTSASQRELHKSNGTAGGTVLLKNLSGTVSANPLLLTAVNSTLYFTVLMTNGQRELYKSNGSAGNTVLVENLSGTTSAIPQQLTAVGNRLFFTAFMATGERELFVSTGTAAGTKLVKNLSGNVSSVPVELTAFGNQVYFSAKIGAQRELHRSNGNAGGTKLVKNLSGTVNASPSDMIVIGGKLFFAARHSNGNVELFSSDGTAAGTLLLKNLSGTVSSAPAELVRRPVIGSSGDAASGSVAADVAASTAILATIRQEETVYTLIDESRLAVSATPVAEPVVSQSKTDWRSVVSGTGTSTQPEASHDGSEDSSDDEVDEVFANFNSLNPLQ